MLRKLLMTIFLVPSTLAFLPRQCPQPIAIGTAPMEREAGKLQMGILDSISDFLNDRQSDFVQLESTQSEFGPGPAILLYDAPAGVADEEILDMLSDVAPNAFAKGVALRRISSTSPTSIDKSLLDKSLQSSLEEVAQDSKQATLPMLDAVDTLDQSINIPVLLFSGFTQSEMMASYNIIGSEIYQETMGQKTCACAMAVPNAMGKQLGQVLDEIRGDHQEALKKQEPVE